MLASITPLGERGRHRRWGTTAAWYMIGSILGGATIGAVAGGAGSLWPEPLRPSGLTLAVIVITGFTFAALIEVGIVPAKLPSLPRQVNENWLDTYRGWVIGLGFGYQLGLAAITIITSAAVHLMLALAVFTYSVQGGLVIGATFGVARALPLLATRSVTNPAALQRVHTTMQRWAQPAHGAVAMTLLATAFVVAVGAMS